MYNDMNNSLDASYAGIEFDFDFSDPFTEASSSSSDSAFSLESSSASEDDGMAIISVSLAFSPSADLLPEPSDLILGSADTIFFYVHTAQLLAASANLFNAHLPENKGQLSSSQPAIFVSEHASVLNILLHAIYKIPVAAYRPVLDDLISALTAMPKYGLDMKQYTAPGSELAELLLANAPLQLLDVYAVANKYGLADLAQRASPHLLSLHLTNVSNELAECMGAVALKKLFFLHLGRIDALKRLLYSPPHPHGSTSECDFIEQKKITRAWALACSYLLWDTRPDLSVGTIEGVLKSLGSTLSCTLCKESLEARVKEVVVQWSMVKRTV